MTKNFRKERLLGLLICVLVFVPLSPILLFFIVLFIDIVGLIWAMKSGVDFVTALEIIFSDEEMAIFASIIGFWFGSRHWDKRR
jgi:hypothetical protein